MNHRPKMNGTIYSRSCDRDYNNGCEIAIRMITMARDDGFDVNELVLDTNTSTPSVLKIENTDARVAQIYLKTILQRARDADHTAEIDAEQSHTKTLDADRAGDISCAFADGQESAYNQVLEKLSQIEAILTKIDNAIDEPIGKYADGIRAVIEEIKHLKDE